MSFSKASDIPEGCVIDGIIAFDATNAHFAVSGAIFSETGVSLLGKNTATNPITIQPFAIVRYRKQ